MNIGTELEISGLRFYTEYQVSIAAYLAEGIFGPVSGKKSLAVSSTTFSTCNAFFFRYYFICSNSNQSGADEKLMNSTYSFRSSGCN